MKRPGTAPNTLTKRDPSDPIALTSVHSRIPWRRNGTSSGSGALPHADYSIVSHYREILAALVRDQGGASHLSEVRLQLIRRFAAGVLIAEQIEEKVAGGEKINITEHVMVSSTLVRIAQAIGLDRKTHDSRPRLADLLTQNKRSD